MKRIAHLSTGIADQELVAAAEISYGVPYTASKAALNVVVTKYALELKEEDIRYFWH